MSQFHKNALQQLFPLELVGVEPDLIAEGASLDEVCADLESIENNTITSGSIDLEYIILWEDALALQPLPGESNDERLRRIHQKLGEKGKFSIPTFITYAANMGITILIEELNPFMSGVSSCGDTLYDDDGDLLWRVYIFGRTGPIESLEQVFRYLKPAETDIEFDYELGVI